MNVRQEDAELDVEQDLVERDVLPHVLDDCQLAPGLDKVAA